jgi:murein DD-endopeptidase MepM/ murein hydrolase activator NlpD
VRVRWLVVSALTTLAILGACEPTWTSTTYPTYPQQTTGDEPPRVETAPVQQVPPPPPPPPPVQPDRIVATASEFAFVGGRLDFELHQAGMQVAQVIRNHYAIPMVVEWEITGLDNLAPTGRLGALRGIVVLPAARTPDGEGQPIEVATFAVVDPRVGWNRHIGFHARFGDPAARPRPYAYGLPYAGTFSILQGFHGAFSHRGSNEYAVDFDCPVATTVRATRPGVVVVTHDAAQGSGTTLEFLDYNRVNFVLVLHDDGTLGEYMHLSPSGVEVQPGQRVERGQALALSGNTGYSTTPHLHFQVQTAAEDGVSSQSFPFVFATGPQRAEEPVQGHSYASWE